MVAATTPIGYRSLSTFVVHQGGAYCTSQGFGVFIGQPKILVVKDELRAPNTTGLDIYESLLSQLGYTYGVWDNAQFYPPVYNDINALSNDIMKNYEVVLWFTGYDYISTLTPTGAEAANGIIPETELASYLARTDVDPMGPGRLIVSSQDYLWDKYGPNPCATPPCSVPPADFAYAQLKVGTFEQDTVKETSSNIDGEPGSWPSEYCTNTLVTPPPGIFPNYADMTTPVSGAKTWGRFTNFSSKPTGVANIAPSLDHGKVVFFPFAFENLVDNPEYSATRLEILRRTLCQMYMTRTGGGTPASVPGCSTCYEPPGPLTIPLGSTLAYSVLGAKSTVNPLDGDFTWTDQPKYTCYSGRPVYGRYRVRRATTPTALADTSPRTLVAPGAKFTTPSADRGLPIVYYDIDTYADDFDQLAPTVCP